MPTAEEVLLAIRARGCETTNLRDAAHEAHHAIEASVPEGKWGREAISKAVKRMGPGRAARSEIVARAVEQIVCERLGVTVKPLEERVGTSCMEAIKFREPFLDYDAAVTATKNALTSKTTLAAADTIIALADVPFTAKKAPKRAPRMSGPST
jgi:hypothetical protein